ncbi:hypothetical protein [Peptoniphilus catoniae]|uniref:hypothetical protein n=1 Tax=Peptoniphilus catoniae TaxID=1660341 RepID=UPI0010FDDD01|nr:hypothetical protein [Peptoniphilus catoniae]
MKKRYIDYPYEKEYQSDILKSISPDYKSPAESIIFFGTEKLEGDIYTINSKRPELREIAGTIYFKTDGDKIIQAIDYPHRLDLMQQNLVNALVRLCIEKSTDLKINDYKISSSENLLSLNAKDISYKNVDRIEELANHLSLANLKISKDPLDKEISIEGYGKVSYEGPCLERTGEVGIIKIKKISRDKDKIILHLVGGERALKDYRDKAYIISNLKSLLFLNNEEDILKEVKALKSNFKPMDQDKIKNLAKEDKPAKEADEKKPCEKVEEKGKTEEAYSDNIEKPKSEEYDKNEIKKDFFEKPVPTKKPLQNERPKVNLASKSQSIEGLKSLATRVGDVNYIYKIIKNISLEDLKEISSTIMKEKNYIQIYGLEGLDGAQIIVTRSQNLNIDLKSIMEEIPKGFTFNGYGNIYQVVLNLPLDKLSRVMELFLIKIKNAK